MMDPEKISKLRIVDKEQFKPGGRSKWKIVLAVVMLIGGVALTAMLVENKMLTPAPSVQTTAAAWIYPSQVVASFNASGYVVAQRRASVASKGTGRIAYLGVREGIAVKEGQVLARLENEDLRAEKAQIDAQLAAARSDLARAETDVRTAERGYRRYQSLLDRNAVARADYDNATDQLQRARAGQESARSNIKAIEAASRRLAILIDYTEIRAPFDGVVLTKDADVGEVVAPFGAAASAKAAVVTMADLSSLMVETDVAEAFLAKVQEGQACEIQLAAIPDVRFSGRVATIVPTADRTRGTVMVKVRLDQLDPRILPEMSVRVAFLTRPLAESENKPFLAVHRDALTERSGTTGLFRIDGQTTARWTPIPSPEAMGDYILPGQALQGGEQIVLKPSAGLEDGARIKVTE